MKKIKWFLVIFISNNFLPVVAQDIPTLELEDVPSIELACKNRGNSKVEIFRMPMETQTFFTPDKCYVGDEVTDDYVSRTEICQEGIETISVYAFDTKSGEMFVQISINSAIKQEYSDEYDCERTGKRF